MVYRSPLIDKLPKGSPFTVSEASRLGVPKASLYRFRDLGVIDQLGPGLYFLSQSLDADLDLLEAAYKAPLATICLSSALARHGLIDEIEKMSVSDATPILSPTNFELDSIYCKANLTQVSFGLHNTETSYVSMIRRIMETGPTAI